MTRLTMSQAVGLPAGLLCLALAACGGDEETCDPIAQSGCDDGLVCEVVQDGEPACFAPVVVQGRVFDLGTDGGVEGGRVVALDANGAPASSVAVSGTDGAYELAIPSARDADGNPVALEVTLRADAAGYQTFPGGLRLPQPVDTGAAVSAGDGEPWVLASAQTDIGLIGLEAGAGTAIIRGTAERAEGVAGTLVVAETAGAAGSAIADRDGSYAIFNLAPGDYTVQGYARGVNYESAAVTLAADDDATVDLAVSDAPAVTLSGSVQIVNPGDGTATSVILVVESTFNEALARGDSPPGLRAPEAGTTIDGTFEITGVPDGRYVALAAFEDDFLVRDPDSCIAGTDIVHLEVAGADLALDQSFKITGSLDIIGPGADGPEAVDGNPTFTWVDDSSEDSYLLTVLDSFGQEVWSTTVPGSSGADPAVAYEGPALEAGMYYQWRVVSQKTNNDAADPFCELSATEDLKGVFYVP